MKAIAPVTTPVLVELTDGQPTTTSLDVAAHFRKQHKTVLRAIANLECSPEFNQHNFAPIEYTDAAGRKYTQYRMTRDGFTFLLHGLHRQGSGEVEGGVHQCLQPDGAHPETRRAGQAEAPTQADHRWSVQGSAGGHQGPGEGSR
ncbi:Rha family transcriptional regulator (plasmid) [Pseudomonas aeruginosa]|nr:Rha family transcriptional regulator [Pseudomonas aeruginosa]